MNNKGSKFVDGRVEVDLKLKRNKFKFLIEKVKNQTNL